MAWALPILTLLLPLWVFTMGQLRDGQHVALMAAVPGLLSLLTRNWWLRGFCVLAGLGVLMTLLAAAATPDEPRLWAHREAVRLAMWLACGVAVYVAGAHGLASPRSLACGLTALAAAQALVVGSQSLGHDPVMWVLRQASPWYALGAKFPPHQMGGTLGNPNFVSAAMALAVPAGWLLGRRWFLAGAAAAALFCVTQSTSTALMAIWAGVMVVALYAGQRRLLLAGAAGAALALAAFLALDNGLLELAGSTKGPGARMTTWGLTVAHWGRSAPLFGLGAGSWPDWWAGQVGQDGIWWKWRHAHNEFIELGFEHGLAGLGLVLGGLASALRSLWQKRGDPEAVFLAGLLATGIVSCMGNFSLHLAPLAVVILAGLGLAERVGGPDKG